MRYGFLNILDLEGLACFSCDTGQSQDFTVKRVIVKRKNNSIPVKNGRTGQCANWKIVL